MLTDSPYILVVGGAGYIGSHMVLALRKAGYIPVVLDNLSKGHRHAVINAPLYVGDMNDAVLLRQLFTDYQFAAVMHFAAFIEVAESMRHPLKYYQNNVTATAVLLGTMLAHQVKRIVFSSTAAVYGEPRYSPIDEAHPLAPINPYGSSKWMVEMMLRDLARSDGLQYSILRYFNAAGADPERRLCERHEPESHLIPLALQAAMGKRAGLQVFGRDYPTTDGTCVRDYVHVSDLCDAHLLALQAMMVATDNRQIICNLGNGLGYSVQEVIESVQRVTGKHIKVQDAGRRAGDPAVLVADATFARQRLNWRPQYSELDVIVKHAWRAMTSQAAVVA